MKPGIFHFQRSARPSACQRGFTLLELVVAMLTASVLLVGLSSALYLTLQSTDPDIGGHDSTLRGSQALVELSSELRLAKTFSVRTDKAVEFTVADRTGDESDDTIRWEWSGVAGDPLTRRFNGGSTANYLDNVHDFQLSYNIKSLTTSEESSGEVTSDETLLADFEGWEGITPTTTSNILGTTKWTAEYFQMQGLPAELSSMSITKVAVRLKKYVSGNVLVSVHLPVDGGVQPESSPVGSAASVSAATLSTSFEWIEFSFSDVTFDALQEELVILVKASADNAARVEYLLSASAPSDSHEMTYTTSGGGSWYPSASMRDRYDVPFRVWGTYTTLSASEESVTRYFVVSSDGVVQVGPSASQRVETTTPFFNCLEVPEP